MIEDLLLFWIENIYTLQRMHLHFPRGCPCSLASENEAVGWESEYIQSQILALETTVRSAKVKVKNR